MKLSTRLVVWYALLFTSAVDAQSTQPAESAMTVAELKCEMGVDPMGIDVARPRLSWKSKSDVRGEVQSAYEILVSGSKEIIDADRGDLWDSAKIESNATLLIRYKGKPLLSSQRVYWKVRSWDRDHHATAWSTPATWTMGILKADEWKGAWIVAPGSTESLLLRRSFQLKPNVRRAIVHVSGLGQYEFHLNGKRVGNDLLSPGWTDYDNTALYNTYDVTSQLVSGGNVMAMTLCNGMYNVVKRDRFTKYTGSFGPLRAMVHLRIEYEDGSADYVGTDEKWKCSPGSITYSSIYGGESVDGRLIEAGAEVAGFDDSKWPNAVALVRPSGTLRGYTAASEPIREIESRDPVSSRSFPDGSIVYDFGQNASYMPRLKIRGPVGATVKLTPAEIVNADGTIQRSTTGGASRGSAWWQYTKGTDGEESYLPISYYVGCRYLKSELIPASPGGALPTIEQIQNIVVHSNAASAGEFSCSNNLLNQIRDLVRWSQRSNMVSVLTDCPHREKLGWIEQLHLNGPAIRYEFSLGRTFNKAMRDMADAQEDDGLIPTVAPDYPKFKGAFHNAAEWGASFILVAWQQYQFEGDVDLLTSNYDAMKRYFAYLQTRANKEDDTLSDGLGDWFDLGGKKPGKAQLTPPEVTASAYYFYDAATLAKIATVIGNSDEAKEFDAIANRIRSNYNKKFFHPDDGSYSTNSQTANAMPIVMGIADPANRSRLVQHIVDDVQTRGDAMTSGDIGFRYLLQALVAGGRSDVIYKMINQSDKPGYGYMIKKGETALCESWDANATTSHNHFMLGQITEWFYKDLAGIDVDPAGPGFEKILIHPTPVGDLKWVQASYDSAHSRIAVRWERDRGMFKLRVTIPANTSATVMLPSREAASVLESNKALSDSIGVKLIAQKGDRTEIAIEAGKYEFTSRY